VGVDAKDGIVAVEGWQVSVHEPATEFVARMAQLGAKRFIFTDIARDGMLQGVNTTALVQVAAQVPALPVIASGGVTALTDIDALVHLQKTGSPNLEGVIVGKALYAGTVSLPDLLARAH
jgi:phosphoribosylformimino-5-aminoimidazole carboxamide ribotide isomerase